LQHTRELEKLSRNLGGIANLERLPNAIFVIDTKKEHIAVTEARSWASRSSRRRHNCDPDVIDYVIRDDDAIRSGSLMCRVLADAVVEVVHRRLRRKNAPPPAEEVSSGPSPPAPAAGSLRRPGGARGRRTRRDCAWRGRVCRRHAEAADGELAEVATGAAAEA